VAFVSEFVETNLNGDEILVVDEPSNGLMLKCKTGLTFF